jgi:hypothetical protein
MWAIILNQKKLCSQEQIQIACQLLKIHVTSVHQGGFPCSAMTGAQDGRDNLQQSAIAPAVVACQSVKTPSPQHEKRYP